MLGQAAIGGIEEEIHFVHAGGLGVDRDGTEAFQGAEKGFGVGDGQLDLGFLGHGRSVEEKTR